MQDLTGTLFKPYTLVVIRLEDGETIQGSIVITKEGKIQVVKEDGSSVIIDQELLAHSQYCYTAFPTIRERIAPIEVKSNGTVSEYDNSRGFVMNETNSRYVILESSLLDPKLQVLAESDTIVGTEVLYVIEDNQKSFPPIASVIKAGELDAVLDVISMLAEQGKINLANKFCELIRKHYPEDEDVKMFSLALKKAEERAKPTDFYEAFPPTEEGMLKPLGRIYEIVDDHGFIIEQHSHRKLYFLLDQMWGDQLTEAFHEDLIGRPVLYSIKEVDRNIYQARTVIAPMSFGEGFSLAQKLYQRRKTISACDVLRLMLKQKENPLYRKTFNAWSSSPYVQYNIWDMESFDAYNGKTEQLLLASPQKDKSIFLNRQNTHTQLIREFTNTPEVPFILSPSEMAKYIASLPQVSQASANLDDKEQEEPEEIEVSTILPEKQGLPSALPSLENCPDGDVRLKATASIMVAFRDGTLFVEGEDKPYKFRVEDIIDDELRNRAEMYSTKFIQDEPVVCQLSYAEHKATRICPPKTVYEMLSEARKAIILARSQDPAHFRAQIYELYDRADGYASIVLDAIQGHRIARELKKIAQSALVKYSDTCYKAPFNAIKPCGEIQIVATKKQPVHKVKDPLFSGLINLSKDSIIDRDYIKPRKGDELVYSVYPGGKDKIPVIRFACLARPTVELIEMAEQWEREGNVENAWGIAMNVLDADPAHVDAQEIVNRCQPEVDDDVIHGRQSVLREDLFAQGQIAAAQEQYERAIDFFTRILDSQDENISMKEQSAVRVLDLYSLLYSEAPQDKQLRTKYRTAGEKYILWKHNSSYALPGNTKDEVEAIIRYYTDMGDIAGLISAYQNKLELLYDEGDTIEQRAEVAQANAMIAWYYLLVGDKSNAPFEYAKKAASANNDLGRVCNAILRFRLGDLEKEIREKGNFSVQEIATFTESYASRYADQIYKGRGKKKSLTYERFALLSAIVQQKRENADPQKLIHYVGRYLATLTGNEDDYMAYLTSTQSIPDDCNFVSQVYKCLKNGPTWSRQWMDIRLLCMLSEEAAYKISSAMYALDFEVSANILIRANVENMYPKPQPSVFARGFAQWRGASILNKYKDCIEKAEVLEQNTDLGKCIEFFRNLKYESWMIQDDKEFINEFRRLLPGHLSAFNIAESSRAVKTASREITNSVNDWNNAFKDRPTVLMMCAFTNLLWRIRLEVEKREKELNFSEPELRAKVLTTSVLDADYSLYLEVEIRNKDKKAEPILDCHLVFEPTEDIIPDSISPVVTYSETERVFGDEAIMYILRFKINPDADQNNLAVKLNFEYKVKTVQKQDVFNLKFKPLKKWTDIENFFNPGAPEYNHFYGRQAYIKKVVSVFSEANNFPHFFIYGQKRSGKSSVLFQIQKRLSERIPSAIMVKIDFLGIKLERESDFYYLILKRILQAVDNINEHVSDVPGRESLDPAVLQIPKRSETDYDMLLSRLWDLKAAWSSTKGWEDSRLILFIDEFTIAYEGILEGLIPNDFMHRWKSLQDERLFGAVLVGQDVLHAFINETAGPNAFDILDKERLNYLEPDEARRLIIETMESLCNRKDVFVGNAVDRILYYSASSAHYTKWICSRLVDYMNARKQPKVTEADIDAVVWRAIETMQPKLLRGLFDPLLFAGLKDNLSRFTEEQTKRVLDIVADEELRNPTRGCRRVDLIANGSQEELINDLVERGVLIDEHDDYTLRLKLYLIWYQVRSSLRTF